MSYILEALKKADRERTLGEVPDLESAHWGVRRPQRSWRWLWIVVVLLLFNAVLLGYLLSRDEVDMEQVAGTAPVTPPVVVSPPVPASPLRKRGSSRLLRLPYVQKLPCVRRLPRGRS
jgi:hypothetical protein